MSIPLRSSETTQGRRMAGARALWRANGMTEAEILAEYPDLEAEDIRQALRYVAWLATEQILPARSAAR